VSVRLYRCLPGLPWSFPKKSRVWQGSAGTCHVWSDAEIQAQLPAWQGCDAELAALADELARYYELGGR
jgi:hypothetical protein